jgi:glycine/D-amino acid oxidase-like deaminating enzyme
MADQTIIIGAGVIGAATALALQNDGHDVTLIDRCAPCSGASFGNAGAIINGSCAPTAMPGILLDALRLMARPDSPISIRPAYFHKILPWLSRFILQSRRSAVNNNARNLHALSQHAVASWQNLVERTELASLFKSTGWLKVYESERSFAGTQMARDLLDTLGTPYDVLDTSQIHDLEPNLAPIFTHGLYQKDSLSISNPERLVTGMVDLFTTRGGKYRQFAVDHISIETNEIKLIGHSESLHTKKVVLAVGSWSRNLASQLGDNVPLEAERGYHLILPESTQTLLSRPVLNGEKSFVLSPMETGLRMTALSELGGLEIPANYGNIRKLLPHAKRMLPAMDTQEESVWMGFRPSLPDSLPVLGFSGKSKNIIYAFGHQHLGITLAAISARIVADLFANREPSVPIAPYRPNRFVAL